LPGVPPRTRSPNWGRRGAPVDTAGKITTSGRGAGRPLAAGWGLHLGRPNQTRRDGFCACAIRGRSRLRHRRGGPPSERNCPLPAPGPPSWVSRTAPRGTINRDRPAVGRPSFGGSRSRRSAPVSRFGDGALWGRGRRPSTEPCSRVRGWRPDRRPAHSRRWHPGPALGPSGRRWALWVTSEPKGTPGLRVETRVRACFLDSATVGNGPGPRSAVGKRGRLGRQTRQ